MNKIVKELPPTDLVLASSMYESPEAVYVAKLSGGVGYGIIQANSYFDGSFNVVSINTKFTYHNSFGYESKTLKGTIEKVLKNDDQEVYQFENFLEFAKWFSNLKEKA